MMIRPLVRARRPSRNVDRRLRTKKRRAALGRIAMTLQAAPTSLDQADVPKPAPTIGRVKAAKAAKLAPAVAQKIGPAKAVLRAATTINPAPNPSEKSVANAPPNLVANAAATMAAAPCARTIRDRTARLRRRAVRLHRAVVAEAGAEIEHRASVFFNEFLENIARC
jgi:hypothetical protein